MLLIFFDIYSVSGVSMQPTYNEGDKIIGIKHTAVEKGDIIRLKNEEKFYIKRIFATAGDSVKCEEQCMIVSEDISDSNIITLKSNEFFVIGDNYINSIDSRDFGVITRDQIVSKVIFSF